MGKRVPLTIHKDGRRIVIGDAYVEDDGVVNGYIDDLSVAEKLGMTPDINSANLSVHFTGDLVLDKGIPDEAAVILPFKLKGDSMDPKTGKLYDSVQEAKDDGVENPVEISGRKEEVAFVSHTLSRADWKKKKKRQKNAKNARKRNR